MSQQLDQILQARAQTLEANAQIDLQILGHKAEIQRLKKRKSTLLEDAQSLTKQAQDLQKEAAQTNGTIIPSDRLQVPSEVA